MAWNPVDSQNQKMAELRDKQQQTAQQNPSKTNWVLPVAGMRSDPGDRSQGGNWARGSFGYQKPASKGGHIHEGTDIYADAGSSIVSSVAGTVTSVGYGSKSGYHIRIRGNDGIDYYYAHMQAPSQWSQGTKIQAGIHIGAVGNTGNASGTTPHLHFGMKRNGRAISPNDFLETGTQQKHTPLSAIPGINTPEEMAKWVKEEMARQSEAFGEMRGFDAGGITDMIEEGQQPNQMEGFGASFMRGTLEAASRSQMGGVGRIPVPGIAPQVDVSSALGGGGTDIGNATNPALDRAARDNTEEPDATG